MPNSADIVNEVSSVDGVPAIIPLSIMQRESGGNFNAITTESNGTKSYGLFQLNENGLGKGYTKGQLLNPTINANIAIKAMKPAYATGYAEGLRGADLVEYVANNSGWPDNLGVPWTQAHEPGYDPVLVNDYNKISKNFNSQSQSLQPPSPPNGLQKVGVALGSQSTGAIPGNVSQALGGINLGSFLGLGNLSGWSLIIVLVGIALAAILAYRVVTH